MVKTTFPTVYEQDLGQQKQRITGIILLQENGGCWLWIAVIKPALGPETNIINIKCK